MTDRTEKLTDEEVAAVFWDCLKRSPGHPDRRMTAWGDKTKEGLAATIRRLAEGNKPEPIGPFEACPECGCTDIEVSAWIDVNTNKPTNDEGPTDQAFCPQCEIDGGDGCMKARHLIQVDTLKPIKKASDPYPIEDWRAEVANCDTKLGYADWLLHRIEAEEGAK